MKRFFLRSADVGRAVRYAHQDATLVARPGSWRNSGYGLAAHGGFLYRVHGGSDLEPYQLPTLEMMEPWEVIRRSQLQEEIDGTFKVVKERKKIFSRPDRTKRSGRPSIAEVCALFDGMLCINDAAEQAGVANHALRRAIVAGKLPSLKKHGVYLVTLEDVKKWRDSPRGPRRKNNVDDQPVSYY